MKCNFRFGLCAGGRRAIESGDRWGGRLQFFTNAPFSVPLSFLYPETGPPGATASGGEGETVDKIVYFLQKRRLARASTKMGFLRTFVNQTHIIIYARARVYRGLGNGGV